MTVVRAKLFIIALLGFWGIASWAGNSDRVMLNFPNTDVVSVIKAVGIITGKNFLIDPRVKGTVNIVSSQPVSPAMVYPILLSALRLQGYAAVESHGIIDIVPEADAKSRAGATIDNNRPSGGEVVTQVYALKYQSATQMVPVLRPLISNNNPITAHPGNNTLVITDYADNLKRIDRIIDAIDQPTDDTRLITLQHASALDVARILDKLVNPSTPGGAPADAEQKTNVVVDARTNSVILESGNSARLEQLKRLAERLDRPTGETDNIHVIYLKNADASQLADTLNAIISGNAPTSNSSAPNPSTTSAMGASMANNTSGPSSASASSAAAGTGNGGGGAGNSSGSGAGSGSSNAPLSFQNNHNSSTASGGIVQADTATNSLIITAPEAVYNNLRSVIDKLDERRAQIFVEALIAEIDESKAAQFGVQWQDLSGVSQNSTQLIGGTNFSSGSGTNIMAAASNITSVGQGLNVGLMRGQVNIPGVGTVLNLGMLAQALETIDNANILSTPDLMTLDNQQAKIIVGQNIPLVTGSYAQTGTTATVTPFQTYDRKDVGLTLQIKPQISEGGSIKLQIYQEVSSVDTTTLNNPSGPTTNLRSIDSTVLVDDGQIVVLGGLIQNSVSDSVSKVPVLGDLPWLGGLFRYKSRTGSKTNLMVFLRPHILRTKDDYNGLTTERYRYIFNEQNKVRLHKDPILPEIEQSSLPPLKPTATVPPAPAK